MPDNMKVVSEFNSGLKDSEGNEIENDFSIRALFILIINNKIKSEENRYEY